MSTLINPCWEQSWDAPFPSPKTLEKTQLKRGQFLKQLQQYHSALVVFTTQGLQSKQQDCHQADASVVDLLDLVAFPIKCGYSLDNECKGVKREPSSRRQTEHVLRVYEDMGVHSRRGKGVAGPQIKYLT